MSRTPCPRRIWLPLFPLVTGLVACHGTDYGDEPLAEDVDIYSCEGWDEADFPDQTAQCDVREGTALMWGTVGPSTPGRLEAFLDAYPDLELLVLPYLPGSNDDESNLEAGRMLYEAGIATCVPSTGMIASGGVDLFLAGSSRTVGTGGQVGVHSWSTWGGASGAELPTDDPEHDMYLDYYEDIGISEDFYWFTLDAAAANSIHWMTADELVQYGVVTDG